MREQVQLANRLYRMMRNRRIDTATFALLMDHLVNVPLAGWNVVPVDQSGYRWRCPMRQARFALRRAALLRESRQ